MPDLRLAVGTVLDWPVDHVAAAVLTDAVVTAGDTDRVFRLASVTKLLTAYATLIAVEEGAVDWDTPAGPPEHAGRVPWRAECPYLAGVSQAATADSANRDAGRRLPPGMKAPRPITAGEQKFP